MTDSPFARGDKIVIKTEFAPDDLNGVVFEVAVVNPKNIRATRIGGGKGINYPKDYLDHFEGEVNPEANVPVAKPYVPIEIFDVGEIVTLKVATAGGITTAQPLVVFKDDGRDRVNVTKLGGWGARYWRMPRTNLVKRDLEWLKSAL